jgi:hypothetical protein
MKWNPGLGANHDPSGHGSLLVKAPMLYGRKAQQLINDAVFAENNKNLF